MWLMRRLEDGEVIMKMNHFGCSCRLKLVQKMHCRNQGFVDDWSEWGCGQLVYLVAFASVT